MNHRITAFLLVPLAGLFLLFHHASYQPFLSQGDHGRDLYAFVQATHGAVPYRDYWWVYGPLMPYYYALFLKIFGVAIPSVLVGKGLLTVLSGVFVFFALSRFIPILFAFMAAMWFWMYQPDFFFTYNHSGGILCLTAIIFALFSYIKQPKTKYLGVAVFLTFVLALIKVNFGIASLFVVIVFYRLYDLANKIPLTDGKKKLMKIASGVVPILIFFIYFLLLCVLPGYEIRQCLPYLTGDQPYHSTPQQALFSLGMSIILTATNIKNPANVVFAIIIVGSLIGCGFKLTSKNIDPKERMGIISAFLLLLFFYFVNLHEYLFSGVLYRSFWATPFTTMMIFLAIGYAFSKVNAQLQRIVFGTFFVIVFSQYVADIDSVRNKKIPEQFLAIEHGRITAGNDPRWFSTVTQTTEFLKKTVPHDQTFLALPYDPLYYYLTDRTSPTRQLIFFEHINIPQEQEATIIAELERNKVNYILISNRAIAKEEPGLGVFGTTYCTTLAKFIADNFEPIAQFGDWRNEPGWAWNHGTQVLKRKKIVR